MKLKVITGILLILLLTNIITAFNATSVFALVNNSSKTENTAGDLLKNVNFNETLKDAVNSTNTGYSNLLDFGEKNQTDTELGVWGTNSTQVVVGLSNTWGAYGKVEQLALTEDGKMVNKVSMGGKVDAVVVDVPGASVASFVTEVKEDGLGRYVEPSVEYQVCMVPNDPYWSLQWGPQKIQADYAWNTTTGSNKVLVCVVDTGIDYNHPDLAANYVPLGYNWVSNNSDVLDDFGHGTHCAGIIAAEINNGVGIAGLAQVKIMAEKAFDASGYGTDYNCANAIINATDAGAKIISMSWGGSSPSTVLEDALKYAYDHGVLLVAAAGNSGSSTKSYPAAYPDVIAVTATDSNDQLAYFSSYGDWVELAAPGVDIYSTTPTYPVTLSEEGVITMNYSYLSGTSMACPCVAGVAALTWSEFPKMSRDVLRLHLRDTADDLGTPGFDIYYGYGRVNANRSVTEPLPAHDIVIGNLEKPPYIETNKTGIINATLINYGGNNETNVNVQWLVNSSIAQSNFYNMTSGASTEISFSWTPKTVGNYNVTVYAVPVAGETNTANNIVQGYVYVGIPLKVFVLRSAGTELVTDAWDSLNNNWEKFGNQLIYIDYTTLDKYNITYNDLKATGADVLILSCAYAWEYTDQEIAAIEQYVYEGHGFIITAGTFYDQVPNNNKFLPMLGMNESISYGETGTDLLNILQPSHPLFAGVPNPYTMPSVGTALPYDGAWSSNELAGGTYVAMGYFNESAIVTYRGLVYISPWLEEIPDYYRFNLQILYNAIKWSKYQKPQHELTTTLQVPEYVFPNSTVMVNATVTNDGAQNESNVDFLLSIYDLTRNQSVQSQWDNGSLTSGASRTVELVWNTTIEGAYNVTAYAVPVAGETNLANNKVTIFVSVTPPLIQPQEGQWANYRIQENISGQQTGYGSIGLNYSKYLSPYLMNVTLLESISEYPSNMTAIGWTTVNIFNRYCEAGVWEGLWFPGRIETNITLGSSVNLLSGPATVIGSEALVIGTKIADCWKLLQNYPGVGNYTWWYDKTNGLWIKMVLNISEDGTALNEVIMLDSTNIPTGYTPAHELQVTLEAPNYVSLGKSSMLNATVFNYGLNNEANVTLALEINNATVGSPLYVPELVVNGSRTMSYLWTPLNEGEYNVTAYAQPVPGENITSDNTATAMVKVQVVKGYVLFDQTHMTNNIGMYSTWITNLQNKGYVVNLYNNSTGTITSTVLEGYNAFVTINPQMEYSDAELSAIKGFVDKGGGLLVIGGYNSGFYTSLTAFAGITWTYGGVSGFTTHITPHEVTQGVSQVYLFDPMTMMNLNGSAQALVEDNYMEIMLAVNWYSSGRVMGFADQYCLSDLAIGEASNLQLATNMIAWLCEKDTTPPQVLLITPSNGTLIGTTSIAINWTATDSQSGIDKYSIYRNGQFVANITNEQLGNVTNSTNFVANTTIQSYTVPNLVKGSNNITIVAYDKAGNHASAQVTIIVDLTPPTIAIISPANNSYVRQMVAINVSGFDIHFSHMDLRVDSQLVASFNSSGKNTYRWNTSTEQYGVHRITLVGYDSVGNNANVSIMVTVDNTLPTAIILSPANATYAHGNITITFIAQDLSLKNASITIGNTYEFNVTGMNSLPFNTTLLGDGSYMVKLEVYGLAGNKAEASITIAIDNTVPEAQITNPSNSTFVRGSVGIDVSYSDTNFKEADLSIGGAIVARAISAHVISPFYTWDTTTVTDGMHIIALTVSDYAGNTRTVEIRVFVDNTPPTVSILSPANNTYVHGDITITFTAQDTALENASITIGATHVYNVTGMTTSNLDTTLFGDGLYTVKLMAYDLAGNSAETLITLTIDNTPPTAHITSPANNAFLKGRVWINVTFSDTNLDKATLSLGKQVIDLTNSSILWNTTAASDGKYLLTLTVSDKAGNTQTDEITVTVDNTPPIGEILSPSNSTYHMGSVDITFYGYDANLVNMSLRIDGSSALQTWNTSGTHDQSWDTTTTTEGTHTITLTIYDKAGNQFAEAINVIVHNTPPTVSIVLPQLGATVSGTVTINYTATDASTLELFIDNSKITVNPNQTYQWDTTKVVDGNHTIRIVATNIVGNTKEASISVNVANAAPAYMTYIGYVSAAILGLALGALAVWVLLKRKPSSPTTPAT